MKFSVLIPAYKSKFLTEAIDSVLCQTYSDFELIIVDDCSPEDLKSVVEKYSDYRVKYYRNSKNYGAVNVVENWNKCLSYAVGDYVICMGDDDKLTPSCLADYFEIIQKNPGLSVYHTRTVLINETSEIIDIQEQRPEFESGYSLWWHRWNGRHKQYIGDFLFHRSHLLENNGFFNLPLAWASDDITAVRASIKNGIANVQKIGFMYRVSNSTISMSANERKKADAILKEKSWYDKVISSVNPQNEADTIMFSLLKKNFSSHFAEKLIVTMNCDIKNMPFRFVYWYKNSKKFGLTKSKVLYYFFRSIVFSFKG